MTTRSPRRRMTTVAALSLATALSLASCAVSEDTAASADEATSLDMVLAWYPDPESGGFYAAEALGYYDDIDLDVSFTPGGPNVSSTQIVASGRSAFGMSDAGAVLQARAEGIPIVAIAAMYQINPVGVMVHASRGVESFEDMRDMTFVSQTGQIGPEWVGRQLGVELKTQAYSGSIANFINDDSLVQQGWPTNETYQALEQGVETDFFPYAEAGINPYNDVIFTTEEFLAENPEVVRDFLEASMQGWYEYMSDIEAATAGNELLLADNEEQSPELQWYGWDRQREYIVAEEGAGQLGTMTEERWATLIDQFVELGRLEEPLEPSEVFDASFLPDIAAPTELPPAPEGSY
ncbi:ABC transporter substrate-binding protein [Microbacterium sp. Marseille-Q6965]|uniref:ABC transporter substrate-binding protein n=1 Tax=Microbacterium sp. Marseille-Q6965 TaxID=2965072 RepID=UPI0021B83B5F|nr:ABC transporter substrate-binding protein [Microbacterium sp. Marseille-Q6965]